MTSPTLAHAMKWLREGALDSLDGDGQGDADAFDRLALIFDQVFATREGEVVLQVLLDVTLFRTPVDHRLEGEAYLRFAQLRQGQNQTMATIVAYLDRARTLKEAPNDRNSDSAGGGRDDDGRPSLDDIRDFFDSRDSLPRADGPSIADERDDDWSAAVH